MKALLYLLLIPYLLSACASNPTGGANFVLMSENGEIEKGKELHEALMKETPVYNDKALQAYVNEIGQKMAAHSHRPELEYHFTIIDSPEINAFALPGGYIYINRGLMYYLTSEAQLAAVLGHEIGHVTDRHAVRQQSAGTAAQILSGVLVVATGVREIQETSALVGGALLSGYGRDMELAADGLSAEYLVNAGYDPNAMIEVITALKNHEDFNKRIANQSSNYHGLFASHPRNDVRLKGVINKAVELSAEQQVETDPSIFRQHFDGLPLGPALSFNNSKGRNRYYQNLFNYTVIFPDNWESSATTTTVKASPPNHEASLKIEVRRLQENKEPHLFIQDDLNIANLQKSEAIRQFGLSGYTGINPNTNERVGVIYYQSRVYIFTGNGPALEGADALFLETIKSFRPITREEQAYANPIKLNYQQSDGSTYAELARSSRLSQNAEDLLRLYNGDYPSGEPSAGQWIKIAE